MTLRDYLTRESMEPYRDPDDLSHDEAADELIAERRASA